jgi:hypothetical protein
MAQGLKQINKEVMYWLSREDKMEIITERKLLKKQREKKAAYKKERKAIMAERRIQMIKSGRIKDKKARYRNI